MAVPVHHNLIPDDLHRETINKMRQTGLISRWLTEWTTFTTDVFHKSTHPSQACEQLKALFSTCQINTPPNRTEGQLINERRDSAPSPCASCWEESLLRDPEQVRLCCPGNRPTTSVGWIPPDAPEVTALGERRAVADPTLRDYEGE